MKFSELWLREWVNTTLDSDALSNQITMAGLEVDGVDPVSGAFTGVVVGLFAKKLNVQEGDFNKRKVATFAIANVVAHAIAWIVVAPVLDILIYAEPANKVFAQGAFAAVSNIITAVVVGGLLILAYTKTIAKKGSLDKE